MFCTKCGAQLQDDANGLLVLTGKKSGEVLETGMTKSQQRNRDANRVKIDAFVESLVLAFLRDFPPDVNHVEAFARRFFFGGS